MSPTRKKKSFNFEQSLKKLEEIVRKLEDEEVTLEQSLKIFAEGKELAKACEAELQAAENKIRQLIEAEDGEMEERPLDSETDDDDEDEDEEEDEAPKKKGAGTKDDLPF